VHAGTDVSELDRLRCRRGQRCSDGAEDAEHQSPASEARNCLHTHHFLTVLR
jgi:hypothetical protein